MLAMTAPPPIMFLILLMVDKYYERIGDHIVKIAEAVEYYVTNQVVK